MRKPRIWILLVFIAATPFEPRTAMAGTQFVDLTGQEYKGPDADLSGLGFSKFGVNCEENGTYVAGGMYTYVSWEDHSGRTSPGKNTHGLKSYVIHVRVKDRKGTVIHEEDFSYAQHKEPSWPNIKGKVVWPNSVDGFNCDRYLVRFSKNVNLSYATIEYWLTKIEWPQK